MIDEKRVFLISMIFLMGFLIYGCGPMAPERPEEVAGVIRQVRTGTGGLDIRFVKDLPPYQIYHTSDLVILTELRNKGVYDISKEKCFLELSGFDPSIVRGINHRQSCGEIEGRSVYNVEGGFNQIEFISKSRSISLPRGVDRYKPSFLVTACYEYQTVAAPQICIDPAFYRFTGEQKACQVRDVSLSGGQGGPVAVSFVNIDMVGSKAIFEIDVSNTGGGRVVSPKASLSRCPVGLKYDEFDQVRYKVELTGGSMIRCAPEDFLVRMTDGRGKIFCTFDVGNVPAYETLLRVELNYNYVQSVSQAVEIIRTPE